MDVTVDELLLLLGRREAELFATKRDLAHARAELEVIQSQTAGPTAIHAEAVSE